VPLRMLFGNWEIGTCIINDDGREAAHKIQWKYMFLVESNLSKHFILMIWRYILTFNAKKITNLTIQYPFKPWALKVYVYIKTKTKHELLKLLKTKTKHELLKLLKTTMYEKKTYHK
jgi:hypothetical protein